MENASKALIMAGSVLLSMIIIGALVFMFNNLRQVKQGEATSEEIRKMTEYNKKIETFHRDLYGSELISLANFIADYEYREVDMKQYDTIKLTVKINTRISDTNRTRNTIYTNYKDLLNDFNKLQNDLNQEKNRTIRIGSTTVTYEKLAGMRDSEIDQLTGGSMDSESLRNQTQKYSDLKLELTNFKNRRFRINTNKTTRSPDNNRITNLEYEEISS